jgi:hypothetical protein
VCFTSYEQISEHHRLEFPTKKKPRKQRQKKEPRTGGEKKTTNKNRERGFFQTQNSNTGEYNKQLDREKAENDTGAYNGTKAELWPVFHHASVS